MPPSAATRVFGSHTDVALAGRYRLLRPLAAGASGRAYVAEDLRLRRQVAVKVLHAALASDAGFLTRFRSEAQAVASLHHPNIVTVHDWGEEPVPFMVLELLTGGSLAALLAAGHRLSASQAARVGEQVAAALEHAHGRGLVHRDIKPANLLFDEHGDVRVADFGLARAIAEASVTEPAGGLVGTARYAAPEQLGAAPLDGRADLYALALVLVEAVSGQVPLLGDTPMATLRRRMDAPVQAPIELGALGVVVEHAGRPDPLDRYPDAGAMRRAILDAAQFLGPPAPLPLAGLDAVPTDQAPTELEDALSALPVEQPAPMAPGLGAFLRRHAVPLVVLLFVVLALGGAAYAFVAASGPVAHVPNLVGRTRADAATAVGESGLLVKVAGHRRADDPPGTVLSQTPAPGDAVDRGSEVRVVVSDGPPPADLPSVLGQTEQEARARLAGAGFDVAVDHRYDDAAPAGTVITQDPSGPSAPRGSTVRLVVSDGPAPVVVPNVVGLPLSEATRTLKAARLTVTSTEEWSDTVARGKVIRQTPVGGQQAPTASPVTLVVSKGPETVQVPDVRGKTVEEATAALQAVGLQSDVVGYKPGKLVKRTDPQPGTSTRRGTTVTLFP